MRQPRWVKFAFLSTAIAPMAIFVVGLIIILTAFPSQEATDFYNNKATVSGTVKDFQKDSYETEDTEGNRYTVTTFYATVDYQINGKPFEVEDKIKEQKAVGDNVTVYYNSRNPSQAALASPTSPAQTATFHLIFGVPLLIIGAVATGLIFYFTLRKDRMLTDRLQPQPFPEPVNARRESRPHPKDR